MHAALLSRGVSCTDVRPLPPLKVTDHPSLAPSFPLFTPLIIEKIRCMHCNFDGPGALDPLVIGDRVLFICVGMKETIWVTVVVESV